jgi:pSer/pThr/pTyr-binding forkhead associated (FHA) protein
MTAARHEIVAIIVQEPGRQPLRLLLDGPLEVGRDCDGLLLSDPLTSRRHVLLDPRGGTVRITDLHSTNGTTVDGRPITGPHELRPGEVVRIGETTIVLLPRGDDAVDGLQTPVPTVRP